MDFLKLNNQYVDGKLNFKEILSEEKITKEVKFIDSVEGDADQGQGLTINQFVKVMLRILTKDPVKYFD